MAIASAAMLFTAPASAHRLDEYLQATMISIEKDRVQVLMRLTPGVAVSAHVLGSIDADGDGVISDYERRAYAERVLGDESLTVNGHLLKPALVAFEFPAVEAMKQGLGEIQIQFGADLPLGGADRKLVFENHHESAIAAYLVNCLVPRDRDIRILAQNRNERQSFYQLDYVQSGGSFGALPLVFWRDVAILPGAAVILLLSRVALNRRRKPPVFSASDRK